MKIEGVYPVVRRELRARGTHIPYIFPIGFREFVSIFTFSKTDETIWTCTEAGGTLLNIGRFEHLFVLHMDSWPRYWVIWGSCASTWRIYLGNSFLWQISNWSISGRSTAGSEISRGEICRQICERLVGFWWGLTSIFSQAQFGRKCRAAARNAGSNAVHVPVRGKELTNILILRIFDVVAVGETSWSRSDDRMI